MQTRPINLGGLINGRDSFNKMEALQHRTTLQATTLQPIGVTNSTAMRPTLSANRPHLKITVLYRA